MRVSRRPDAHAATELARQLGALMRELDLAEIEVSLGNLKVRLQRPGAAPTAFPVPMAPAPTPAAGPVVDVVTNATLVTRSEEHTSELQSQSNLVCRLLLEKKKNKHETECEGTTPDTL